MVLPGGHLTFSGTMYPSDVYLATGHPQGVSMTGSEQGRGNTEAKVSVGVGPGTIYGLSPRSVLRPVWFPGAAPWTVS